MEDKRHAPRKHYPKVQVSGSELCIIESRPEHVPNDLRLINPWPELQEMADSIDLDTCDDIMHEHTPYGTNRAKWCICVVTYAT